MVRVVRQCEILSVTEMCSYIYLNSIFYIIWLLLQYKNFFFKECRCYGVPMLSFKCQDFCLWGSALVLTPVPACSSYATELAHQSIQFGLVTQCCPPLCVPMDCSTPGFPVHHQFPELTQTHVHWVGDAIQPSHPLSSPSPPAFNLSQHQVFSSGSVLCIRWPNYWNFSFSISSSN